MAQIAMPARRLPDLLQRAASDSLVRNSLYLMASTVTTAGLGYIFWVIAAHIFTKQEVGIAAGAISLCSTVALLTYLGPSAMLIERLPGSEQSSEWTAILRRVCTATAVATAAVTVAVVPVMLISQDYHSFFTGTWAILIAVVGAGTTSLLNLLGSAFIAARRAGRFLSMQTLVSVAKLLLLFPLATVGAVGLVEAWVGSAVVGVGVGVVWLIPRMRLGRHPNYISRRSSGVAHKGSQSRRQRPRHRRGLSMPRAAYIRRLLGQHFTSVGGMLTPLLLPIIVVVRLGSTLNAYFYITWMMGSVFFMVSPSVATAVFAEGVRAGSDLRNEVIKAFRIITALLAPAMLIMIVGGRVILGLFGSSYAVAGYGLLVLLVISAIPDAVSNVAVSIWRITLRLGYSAALNLGIMVTTLVGAWWLMPLLGIVGVGVAWLAAQTLGAIASLPAYTQISRQGSHAKPASRTMLSIMLRNRPNTSQGNCSHIKVAIPEEPRPIGPITAKAMRQRYAHSGWFSVGHSASASDAIHGDMRRERAFEN